MIEKLISSFGCSQGSSTLAEVAKPGLGARVTYLGK